ncbi:MAG: ATP-binding cassette domain-containing protein [Actinobacteria bacterium]|nr:ATP-binding cassette domain-containing protein [Actinomycetota bacterium]
MGSGRRVDPPPFRLRSAGVRFADLHALREIDLTVAHGERVALIGPSGAGKSTLIHLLNATQRPTSGTVEIFGTAPTEQRQRALRTIQGRIGTIHQGFDLIGPLRVIHNVNAGHLSRWGIARAAYSLVSPLELPAARHALERVGIGDKIFERTDRLSGGQQQRVALARVLAQDPEVILADEPISNLDPVRSREIMDLLRDLSTSDGRTLVVSVHDYSYALSHCTRVVGLRDGTVRFDRNPEEIDRATIDRLYAMESGE